VNEVENRREAGMSEDDPEGQDEAERVEDEEVSRAVARRFIGGRHRT